MLALLMMTGTFSATAHEHTPWPIIDRCVDGLTPPPHGWTYPGTLLMTGYAGIHAMQADWDMPRIRAFWYADEFGEPIAGGQLSPDGRWYASPIGAREIAPSNNEFWTTDGLRLYSMVDDIEVSFNLSEYDVLLDYDRSAYFGDHGVYQAVRWLDDAALIIGPFAIRLFDSDVIASDLIIAEAYFADFEVAPDWSRVYSFVTSGQRGKAIIDPNEPDEAITYLQAQTVAWRHDSSGFIGHQSVDRMEQLSLFDRDGAIDTMIFASDGYFDIRREVAGRNELGWSPDDRYFAFIHFPANATSPRLLLVDTTEQTVINTCLQPSPNTQVVWSPEGTQIALLMDAPQNLRVVVFDLETWAAHDVARHSGEDGALSPDMLAWRRNDQ